MPRPFITMNMAMTADGKITSVQREHPGFTSREDRRSMDAIRAPADAILIGAGTLRGDDPPMIVRDPAMQARRQQLGKPEKLAHVLVSGSLQVPRDARFFDGAYSRELILATTDEADPTPLAPLPPHAHVWRLGPQRIDFARLLERLYEHGIRHLLVEGGGETNWQVLQVDGFDELHLTMCPALLGGRDAPTWLDGAGFSMAQQRRLQLLEAKIVGDEIFCHYKVVK